MVLDKIKTENVEPEKHGDVPCKPGRLTGVLNRRLKSEAITDKTLRQCNKFPSSTKLIFLAFQHHCSAFCFCWHDKALVVLCITFKEGETEHHRQKN